MRRPLFPLTIFLALHALAGPSFGSDGEIVIVAELAGTGRSPAVECDFWVMKWNNSTRGNGKPPFGSCQPPMLKVYAQLRGASAAGITGAEYGVQIGEDRYPDHGWALLEVPTGTATIAVGSAFTPPDANPRGINFAWSDCQTGSDGRVLLETIVVIPTMPCGRDMIPPTLKLRVGQHSRPSNNFWRCPLFTLCDAPAYTKVCLGNDIGPCALQVPPFSDFATCSTSGSFVLNGKGGPGRCGKGKPETSETWGGVKALYR